MEYEKCKFDIIYFEEVDIITDSTLNDDDDFGGEWA